MSFMQDTSPEAERVYYDLLARMTPEQRLLRASRFSGRMRSILLESIQAQHPEYSDREVRMEYFRRIMTESEFTSFTAGFS